MNAKELWDLAERRVVIRARAGLHDHIELGPQRATDIWAVAQTSVSQLPWLTVVHYMQPAYLNSSADHCGFTVETWKCHSEATDYNIEQMLAQWPETWREPKQVIYDWISEPDAAPRILNPENSVGLLRHLSRMEMWAMVRSEYPEGRNVWDQWHRDEEAQHLGQLKDRLTGYIGDQLRFWIDFGKSMTGFVSSDDSLPDICV